MWQGDDKCNGYFAENVSFKSLRKLLAFSQNQYVRTLNTGTQANLPLENISLLVCVLAPNQLSSECVIGKDQIGYPVSPQCGVLFRCNFRLYITLKLGTLPFNNNTLYLDIFYLRIKQNILQTLRLTTPHSIILVLLMENLRHKRHSTCPQTDLAY